MNPQSKVALMQQQSSSIKLTSLRELIAEHQNRSSDCLAFSEITEVLERLFLPRRHNHLRILVTSPGHYCCAKILASWFYNSELHVMDPGGSQRCSSEPRSRIKTLNGDVSDFDFADAQFDIIFDDAGRGSEAVFQSWSILRGHSSDNCVYVINNLNLVRNNGTTQNNPTAPEKHNPEHALKDSHEFGRFRNFILDISHEFEVAVYNNDLVHITAKGATVDNRTGITFSFGENWSEFNRAPSPHRVGSAAEDLREWFGVDNISGKTVADVGCGSGLHSMAFLENGAASVTSIDVDPSSVAATKSLQSESVKARWSLGEGSVLDPTLPMQIGTFDIVYSWGVLHHTGAMWNAIRNCSQLCSENGLLMLAIYQGGHFFEDHLHLKQQYNRAAQPERDRMIRKEAGVDDGRPLTELITSAELQKQRGMNIVTDAIDWLGGLPYETAIVSEILAFVIGLGFAPLKVMEENQGGCSIFLFRRSAAKAGLGHTFQYCRTGLSFVTMQDFHSFLRVEQNSKDILYRKTRTEVSSRYRDLLDEFIRLQGAMNSGSFLLKQLFSVLRRRLTGSP